MDEEMTKAFTLSVKQREIISNKKNKNNDGDESYYETDTESEINLENNNFKKINFISYLDSIFF